MKCWSLLAIIFKRLVTIFLYRQRFVKFFNKFSLKLFPNVKSDGKKKFFKKRNFIAMI